MSKPSFLQFMQERDQLDEAFNSAPYELTMGKKNAGDVFFTFIDEDEKEYRIQFYTPQGLGKNVRQVFIGQKRGSVYPDAIARFKNPMRVIASMIEATKQFLATPLGKTIDGYAVNFSKKALDRGMTLIPKIIRQSGLKQKLNVMDLTYAPVPDRGYVWLVRKGKDPAQVFDGPKMQGITWDDPDKVGDVPVQNSVDDVVGGTGQTIVVGVDFRSEMEDLDISVSGNDIAVMDGRKLVVSFTDPETAGIISGMKTPSAAITNFMQKTNPGRYTGNIKVNSTSTRSGKKYEFIASDSSGKQLFNLNVEDSRKTNLGTGAGSSSSVDDSNGWKLTSNGEQPMLIWVGKERGRVNTANIAPHYNEPGVYVGAYMNEKSVRGQSVDFIARQLKLPQVPISILNDFTTASTKFWKGSQQNSDWNISVMAKSNGIFSSVVKVVGANDVTLSSNDLAIMVKDGAMAKIARTQSIAQVTVFNKEYVGRGEVDRKIMAASDRQGMGWELKSGGKIVAYVEFGVGAVAPQAKAEPNPNAISSKDLRIPKNASVFGETENGMSITWSGINFPETGKYAGTSMITNVTYYHDKGKVAFTPIVSQKGRTLNNPKTYELTLKKDIVQSMIDEISSKMEYLSRNLQQLKSQTYNPNQVFLNDITITDKGEVIWNDYNLSDGKVTQIMLSMISAENRRLEKVTNKPDITLPKKQAEVVEFINRMIDIDLGPYLREPKKRDVVLFDSSELSINQLNNIERLGRETGKWSLQPNGGMGHALFLNVW